MPQKHTAMNSLKSFFRISVLLLSLGLMPQMARTQQATDGFVTVSGTVVDSLSGKPLRLVQVYLADRRVGTVTNDDGFFRLKIPRHDGMTVVKFSMLGYGTGQLTFDGTRDLNGVRIGLPVVSMSLDGIAVIGGDARRLVAEALRRRVDNYPDRPNSLSGFYRETVQKRQNYINISEAVLNIYKGAYTSPTAFDAVQVIKGRSLVSPKHGDTLAVKLEGGPNLAVQLDVVKSPDFFLSADRLDYFRFLLVAMTEVDRRPHYRIEFIPLIDTELHYGTIYVDTQTLTIARIEMQMDINDRQAATRALLVSKPAGLRFIPDEASALIVYKRYGERSCLNYMRTTTRFRCDWRRRLFSTAYCIVSEMVTTDVTDSNVSRIAPRDAFRQKSSLSDKVADFYEEDFWRDYNIIEPSESLENAVGRLRRRVRNARE